MKKLTLIIASVALLTGGINAQQFKAQNAMYADVKVNTLTSNIAKIVNIDPIEIIAERIDKFIPSKQKQANKNAMYKAVVYDAQVAELDTNRKTDTTEIKVGKTRIVVIGEPKIEKIYMEKDTTGDWDDNDDLASKSDKHKDKKSHDSFEWSIGYNGLLDNGSTSLSAANRNLDLKNGKSINFNMTYNKYFNIVKDNIQLSAGIGLDWNNYRFSRNVSLAQRADSLNIFIDSTATFQKNKLVGRYVTLPVMLHFSSNENKKGNRLTVATGIELGYLINGRLKQVSEERGKQKLNDDFNLNDLRYGLIGRASFGNIGVYGKYYPQSTFKANEGPDLNTFCVGFTFGIE